MRIATALPALLAGFISLSATGQQLKPESPTRLDYALYAGVFASRLGDWYTTERVLDHGGHELLLPNGLVRNKPGFLAFEAGFGFLDVYSSRLVAKRHPRLARTMLAVHIGTNVAVAGHNAANF